MSYQTSSKRSPPFWLLIGARKLLCFSAQSEGRTAATVWNWFGKTLSAGALLAVLCFSSCQNFSARLDFPSPPLSTPWSPRMDEDSHSTDLAWVSWGRSFRKHFYWLITKLFSHKMLRNLTFVVQFPYFSISPKKFLFFEQLFEKLREIFWKISSNFWKAPNREQESIPERWVVPLSVCH